jgi:hypothetical protein
LERVACPIGSDGDLFAARRKRWRARILVRRLNFIFRGNKIDNFRRDKVYCCWGRKLSRRLFLLLLLLGWRRKRRRRRRV